MSKSFDELAARMKQVVLANIRSGAIKPEDTASKAIEKATELKERQRESMAKAQAARLTRKTKMETSNYYSNPNK
jgi:ribosome-binding protein aMBF1 (putative translation factor)